jgi:PadR family transcriptional regulator PadR
MTLNQKIPKHDNSMNIENAQVQMRKGILEFCIMHIISRGEVYASDMLEELTSAKIMVVEGTLYPLLTRLKNSGLLDYKWVESQSGPPRKYYILTDTGKQFLDDMEHTWVELSDSVNTIVHKTGTMKEVQETTSDSPASETRSSSANDSQSLNH